MNSSKKIIILILFFFLGLSLVFWWLRPLAKRESAPAETKTEVPPIKIETSLPLSPSVFSFQKVASLSSLPKVLPVYKVSGETTLPIGLDQALSLGRSLGFLVKPEVRAAYGGGQDYVFSDLTGRVLRITSNPLGLSYSELPAAQGELLTLTEAQGVALSLAAKILPGLSSGWRVEVTSRSFLAGSGSTAREASSSQGADAVRVTLGFFYRGLKVLNTRGESDFLQIVLGKSGSIISARIQFLVNNPQLRLESLGDVSVIDLNGIKAAFDSRKFKEISLSLTGTVSDEGILTPPNQVETQKIEPTLILGGGFLHPYYLVSSQGILNSGRSGLTVFLVDAVK